MISAVDNDDSRPSKKRERTRVSSPYHFQPLKRIHTFVRSFASAMAIFYFQSQRNYKMQFH